MTPDDRAATEAPQSPGDGSPFLPPGRDDGVGEAQPMRQLDDARSQSVRLIVSIPVLFLLTVLGMGSLLYVYLNALSQRPMLSTEAALALERAALFILLLSIVVSLFASLIGYILARQITRPIRDMMGTMEQIALGDFTTKLEPIPLGEFGLLGSSFNNMVEQLDSLFKERDRQLRESFGGAHLIVDRGGTVYSADDSVRRLLGISPSNLLGAGLFDPATRVPMLTRNPRLLDVLEGLVRKATPGQPRNRTVAVRGAEGLGQARYLATTILLDSPVETGDRVLLVLRDISGVFHFYEQIQRADRLAAIGTLATGIAHEIRNPLASIRGMVQLLGEIEQERAAGDTGEESPGYHQRILREVDRLDKLVKGIMEFAQAAESPITETDLNALVREAVECSRYSLDAGGDSVQVSYSLAEDMPPTIYQADRLRQALINLSMNALQHTLEMGGGTVRVATRYNVGNVKPVQILIANPGDPLDERQRERIFEPFYTSKPEGTGLGLPIAYQAISMNAGALELECEDGEICFHVRLPRDCTASQGSSPIIPRFHTPMPPQG